MGVKLVVAHWDIGTPYAPGPAMARQETALEDAASSGRRNAYRFPALRLGSERTMSTCALSPSEWISRISTNTRLMPFHFPWSSVPQP